MGSFEPVRRHVYYVNTSHEHFVLELFNFILISLTFSKREEQFKKKMRKRQKDQNVVQAPGLLASLLAQHPGGWSQPEEHFGKQES